MLKEKKIDYQSEVVMYMSHIMHIILVEKESIALYLKMELHFIIANIRQQRAAHTFTTLIVDSVYICITNVMQSRSTVPSARFFERPKSITFQVIPLQTGYIIVFFHNLTNTRTTHFIYTDALFCLRAETDTGIRKNVSSYDSLHFCG